MQFSLRTKVVLLGLLVLLGFVFLVPTTPHEIGWDSFSVHLMANSISEFGYAKWWLHPASIMGSYPYSTSPSAVPFLLSGMSQGTNINMESTILLYSLFLGIFSVFGAYLMAGVIWNNDIFKFLVTIVLSTSQGIITFSTWTATGRTLFVILLPFFIYLLLKTRTFKVRFSILTFIILALFATTHHYIYFIIPIVISYLIIVMIYILEKHIKSIRIPENIANFVMLGGFLIMFSIPYLYRSIWWGDPELMRSAYVGANSIYVWIFDVMLKNYIRYIGFLIIFVVGGYAYLVLKRNKKFEEWFLLLCLVCLAPISYIVTYAKWFILPFSSLLIGVALTNIAILGMRKRPHIEEKRKYATAFVIILLLFSVSFTGYYQYLHFLNNPSQEKRYMEERTYIGALWIKDNIDKEKNMIGERHINHRVFSTSEVPTLTGIGAADLTYGFVNPQKIEVKQIYSPLSLEFYLHDPYKAINHTKTDWCVRAIERSDINNHHSRAYRLTSLFNLSYFVENKNLDNTFTRSVQQTKECLYDNGKIRIWHLN